MEYNIQKQKTRMLNILSKHIDKCNKQNTVKVQYDKYLIVNDDLEVTFKIINTDKIESKLYKFIRIDEYLINDLQNNNFAIDNITSFNNTFLDEFYTVITIKYKNIRSKNLVQERFIMNQHKSIAQHDNIFTRENQTNPYYRSSY